MINTDMRLYNYYLYGEKNAYGEEVLATTPTGTIKMAINISSQSVQDNINYKDCQYIGITHAAINDLFVIDYEGERLKVMYVNPKGRYNIAFLVKQ